MSWGWEGERSTRGLGGERDKIRNEINIIFMDEILKNRKVNEN